MPPHEKPEPNSTAAFPRLSEVEALYYQHSASLLRYAGVLTTDTTIARGALQETYLRYFVAETAGPPIANARVWLFRKLRHCIAHSLKKAERPRSMEANADPDPTDFGRHVEDQYKRQVLFRRALASLSERQRECMHLRLEGFAFGDIAQIMRIRKRSVGSLLERTMEHFRTAGVFADRKESAPAESTDTYDIITQFRFYWAEAQYRKRIQRRIWAYLFILGLMTAAAALAAILIK